MGTNKKLLMLITGYACFIIACTQTFIPNGVGNAVSESLMARMANNLAFIVAYGLYSVVLTKRGTRTLGMAASVVPTVAVAVAQAVLFLCDQRMLVFPGPVLIALHTATGWSMATLFTFWAGTSYLFDSRQFRYGIFAGSLISCFAVIFVSASGSAMAGFASKEIAIVSSSVLARSLVSCAESVPRREPAGAHPGAKVARCYRSLLFPCVCTGVFGFAYQYTGIVSRSDDMTTLFFTVGEAFAVSIVLLLVTMPAGRPFSMLKSFRYLCPLAFLALGLAAFAQDGLRPLSVGIASTVFNLCLILLMPICADLGRRSSVSAAGLYAGAACFVNAFPTLGYLFGVGLGEGSPAFSWVALAGCALMVFVVVLLGRRAEDDEIDLSVSDAQALLEYAQQQGGGVVIGRGYAASEIARDYGLSEREREVLELALQGKTAPQVSSDLGISPSTVKTHLRNIFQKTNLHSRAELIDLSGEYEARLTNLEMPGIG